MQLVENPVRLLLSGKEQRGCKEVGIPCTAPSHSWRWCQVLIECLLTPTALKSAAYIGFTGEMGLGAPWGPAPLAEQSHRAGALWACQANRRDPAGTRGCHDQAVAGWEGTARRVPVALHRPQGPGAVVCPGQLQLWWPNRVWAHALAHCLMGPSCPMVPPGNALPAEWNRQGVGREQLENLRCLSRCGATIHLEDTGTVLHCTGAWGRGCPRDLHPAHASP